MSNPYTPPSLTGYNANPPSDDGALTAANILKWSNHLTKIGDPLKSFMESVDTNVLAAFDTIFGAAARTISTDYTIIEADSGRFISVTGTTTITLLPVLTAGNGFPLLITNSGDATVTVDADGSETINGDTSLTLAPGSGLLITSDGTSWFGISQAGSIEGSFTATLNGFSIAPTGTAQYRIVGKFCTIYLSAAGISGTSNTLGLSLTGLPAICSPTFQTSGIGSVIDNGAQGIGGFSIGAAATTVTLLNGVTLDQLGFTGSGTKGLSQGWQITYVLS